MIDIIIGRGLGIGRSVGVGICTGLVACYVGVVEANG